jgi:hypothetical protein
MSSLLDLLVFAAGFATCWFARDKIIEIVTGTEALIKTLEAKTAALKAAL